MENLTKENKAITLVALVITVVIMLILISVTTYTGIDTYKNVKVNQFVDRMQLIQAKVDEISKEELQKLEDLGELGADASSKQGSQEILSEAMKNGEVSTSNISEYKYFSADDLLKTFDLDDINDEILVNFNTREVISLTGIDYEGKIYYTQYKLPNAQTRITTTEQDRTLEFNLETEMDGLNASITISDISISNGTLQYQKDGDNYWTTITNYTEASKDNKINLTESGKYKIKLVDNVNNNQIEKELTVLLTNKPKTTGEFTEEYNYAGDSTSWAYAQSGGSWYVWIPRFASKKDGNIKFIKGNSNTATDNTYIDNTYSEDEIDNNYTVHNKFGTNLTGLWVNVNSKNQAGLDMIDLLNSDAATLTEI